MKKNTKNLHHNHKGNTSFIVIAIVVILTLTAILFYAYKDPLTNAVGNVVRQISASPSENVPEEGTLDLTLESAGVRLPFSEGMRSTSVLMLTSTDKLLAKDRNNNRNILTDAVYLTHPKNQEIYVFAQKKGETPIYLGSIPFTSSREQEVIAWTGGRAHNKIQFTYKNVGSDRVRVNVLRYPDQSNMDDIQTYWRTSSANPFSALGAYASRIEPDEIKIEDKYAGDATQDMATNYGGLVKDPSLNSDKDRVIVSMPLESIALR